MAKFINKKEQVFDLKLTPYAKYMMSIGKFKPAYYAFFDDNVLYDRSYASASATETQSDVDKRIKDETQYIESLVLFKDLEDTKTRNVDSSIDFVSKKPTRRSLSPDNNIFKIANAIGDANLDGPSQTAPAWKVAALNSRILSSSAIDTSTNGRIPQIDIESTYVKKVSNNEFVFDPASLREIPSRTIPFADQKVA